MQKKRKKVQKMLIFTPIFELKTNKSYNINPDAITNHPIFQKNRQKPLFSNFFTLFLSPYYRSAAPQFLSSNLLDGLILIRQTNPPHKRRAKYHTLPAILNSKFIFCSGFISLQKVTSVGKFPGESNSSRLQNLARLF
ncbi:MAG: hypothetical protein NTX52_13840 [Planctomycetota bacterium]|nr:hypothetical protein [Planctomycetota bacterium]